jgi:hypothetical protein
LIELGCCLDNRQPEIGFGVANRAAMPALRGLLEPVSAIFIGRFYALKAWIQGKKRSKVEHLASIFNAVATLLGHKRSP